MKRSRFVRRAAAFLLSLSIFAGSIPVEVYGEELPQEEVSVEVLTSEDEAQPPSTDPLSNPSKERGAASAFPRFRQTPPSDASGSFLLVSSCPHLQSEFQKQRPKLSS